MYISHSSKILGQPRDELQWEEEEEEYIAIVQPASVQIRETWQLGRDTVMYQQT